MANGATVPRVDVPLASGPCTGSRGSFRSRRAGRDGGFGSQHAGGQNAGGRHRGRVPGYSRAPAVRAAMVLSESAAGQAAAAAVAERDAIQANLLELDGSFVRQLLDGAALSGQTRQRWDAASAALTGLWETYMAYSAVVDRVAELGVGVRRPSKKDLPELTELLTGPAIRLPGAPVPLARRDLADTGRAPVTLEAAVAAMR